MYLFTFYPYAIGKPDSYIFGSEKGLDHAKLIARLNWHPAGKEVTTLGEWKAYLTDSIKKQVPAEYSTNIFSEAINTVKKKNNIYYNSNPVDYFGVVYFQEEEN